MLTRCKLILLFSILAVSVQSHSVKTEPQDNVTIQELRSMLLTVKEQNRRLVQQNTRLQKVWSAMEQMCDALSPGTGKSNESTIPIMASNENAHGTEDDFTHCQEGPICIVTLETSGAKSDSDNVTLTVTYKAPVNHTTEWHIHRKSGATEGTSGRKTTHSSGKNTFQSEVTLTIPSNILHVIFILRTENETIHISLNTCILNASQIQPVPPPTSPYQIVDDAYSAPQDYTDLEIILPFADGSEDTTDTYLFAYFMGVNTNTTTGAAHTIVQLYSIDLNHPYTTVSVIHRDFGYVIIVPEPYVQFGGLLVLSVNYNKLRTGLIEEFTHETHIKIFARGRKLVVPRHVIGMFEFDKDPIAIPPTRRLYCAGMGNPKPHMAIFKQSRKGSEHELKTETVVDNSWIHAVVHTLKMDPIDPKQTTHTKEYIDGTYVCSASSGNDHTSTGNDVAKTTVKIYKLVKASFDDTKTGVMKNTTSKVVFSCKATGKPAPSLRMTIFKNGQEDVFDVDFLKAKRETTPKYTRIVLPLYPSKIDEHKYIH